MSYNDDAVLAKLSALNESHESIATTAQWIMFHRRNSAQSVHLWVTKLKDLPSAKRLNMIYLANEVVQQSKARHKEEFLTAFSPFIADATATAYRGASADIQNKLRRVVEVWRERSIFDREIQGAMEAKLEELDKARGSTKVGSFGGHMFGSTASSIPSELNPLVAPQQSIFKSAPLMRNAVQTANAEYEKLLEQANNPPAAPVFAARLTGLLKTLANAEGAVTEHIKTRRELVAALEKILVQNKEALDAEETQLKDLSARRTAIEEKKKEVESAIMSRLPSGDQEQSPGDRPSGSPVPEPDRPQVEALTPPHVQDHDDLYSNPPKHHKEQRFTTTGLLNSLPAPAPNTFPPAPGISGIEMLSHLASQYPPQPLNGSSKKRKIEASNDFPDLGGDDGIDEEVAEMLRKDSHSS
ncbi:RNA polymerase II-binding domain-containing protein [Podospora didyma]|uniref:RNA polymerase II-binding domain-containing protein n=1 Tax=Podospora didyma TaxID=330526 RepID=A0AAE0K5A6_9PEZI|nr:RNA polymerase II-binding domain-containing protein [Podospora didyma]